jgi:DNA-binding MarR family transcriptional regulator
MGSGSEKNNSKTLINQTFYILLNCQQKLSYNIARELKAFDITRQQYEVLKILNEQSDKPVNLNRVKSHLRENVPDISRIVKRLVDKRLINRARQANDKRNSSISINENGIELLKKIEPIINSKMDDFFGILDAVEIQELSRIISKVNQNNE